MEPRKEVCQKCYRYNERTWDEEAEEEWEEGRIACPADYFNVMKFRGFPLKADRGLRNLFANIYGWREIADGIPDWCAFESEHLLMREGDGEG